MGMNPRLLRPLATGFDPRRIAGLAAWYASDVASSISLDVNSKVQTWRDLSGNGRDLSQNDTNNRPDWGIHTLNGKPTVTFDGQNDSLSTGAFTLNQPVHVFLVFRVESIANSGQRIFDGNSGNSMSFFNVVNSYGLFAGAQITTTHNDAQKTEFDIYDAEFNSTSSAIRRRTSLSVATGNAGSSNPGGIRLGAFSQSAVFSNSTIAEWMIYSRVLSATEAESVRKYLGDKWNLPFKV